jgi:pyruvate formate lyase activating enzyme
MAEAGRYRSYMRASGGGITLTGGEPLLQAGFVEALFARCREEGIHTALDTSGAVPPETAVAAYEKTDLVLLDFKAFYPGKFERITGVPIRNLIRTCNYLENKQVPVWIRFVLIPGLTDDLDEIAEMAGYLAGLGNVERIEINPFHKLGEYKWEQLGFDYTLQGTEPPSPRLTEQVKSVFAEAGLAVE